MEILRVRALSRSTKYRDKKHKGLLGLTIDVVLKMRRNYETNLRMIQNVLLSLDSLFAMLMLC